MKTFTTVMAASAAALIFAGAASANPTLRSGTISAQLSHLDGDDAGLDDTVSPGRIDAAYVGPVGRNFGFQLDAAYTIGDEEISDAASGAARIFRRTKQNMVGAYVTAIDVDEADDTYIGGGVEADYYVDGGTIGGQIVYLDLDDDGELIGAEGAARIFIQDNLTVQAGMGLGQIDSDDGGDVDFYTLNVGTEYKVPDAPISFTAEVSYTELDFGSGGGNADITAFRLGVSYNFNADTLLSRDRRGVISRRATDIVTGVFG